MEVLFKTVIFEVLFFFCLILKVIILVIPKREPINKNITYTKLVNFGFNFWFVFIIVFLIYKYFIYKP